MSLRGHKSKLTRLCGASDTEYLLLSSYAAFFTEQHRSAKYCSVGTCLYLDHLKEKTKERTSNIRPLKRRLAIGIMGPRSLDVRAFFCFFLSLAVMVLEMRALNYEWRRPPYFRFLWARKVKEFGLCLFYTTLYKSPYTFI